MNSLPQLVPPVVFSDIVVEPQPPPSRMVSGSHFPGGEPWEIFLILAVLAGGGLWWLRRRRFAKGA